MKHTRLTFLSTLILASPNLNAQSWVKQASNAPAPDVCVADISAPSSTVAWSIFTDLHVFGTAIVPFYARTTNGGTTWTPNSINIPQDQTPSSICAINDQTAWIATRADADQGRIYHTANGGQTWTHQTTAAFADCARFVHFFNATEGVAVGDSSVFTTNNGGTTWTRKPKLPTISGAATQFLFNSHEVKGNTVWLGDIYGSVFKSTNKGLTWARMSTTLTSYSIKGMAFKDTLNGIAIVARWTSGGQLPGGGYTDDGLIFRTTDGGNTWSQLTYNIIGNTAGSSIHPANVKYDVAYVPNTANTYIVSAEDIVGYSAYSEDGGDSWKLIDSNIQHTALAFKNINAGWSGGYLSNNAADGFYKWVPSATMNTNLVIMQATDQLKVYPNPVGNELNAVVLNGEESTYTYSIMNVRGQIVLEGRFDGMKRSPTSLDTRALAPGSYFLNVRTKSKQSTIQFTKQ